MNDRSRRLFYAQGENTSYFLPKIEHSLAFGRVQQFHRLQPFVYGDWRTHAVLQDALGRLYELDGLRRGLRQCIVTVFPIIEIGKGDLAAPHTPAFIRAKDFLAAVLVTQAQFCQQFPFVPIDSATAAIHAKAALVPPVAQHHAEGPLLRQQVGHIIGLHLHPGIVIGATRREIFIPDLLTVIVRLIQSETGDV